MNHHHRLLGDGVPGSGKRSAAPGASAPSPRAVTRGESTAKGLPGLKIHANINRMVNQPVIPPVSATAGRERLTLDLAGPVSSLLDHISQVTGSPRSQIALQAILEALPQLVERADAIRKRSNELVQVKGARK